jgi:hypothetical protein
MKKIVDIAQFQPGSQPGSSSSPETRQTFPTTGPGMKKRDGAWV